MATISELMEGKEPGSIKIDYVHKAAGDDGWYFIPYFPDPEGSWHGKNDRGATIVTHDAAQTWRIYVEPVEKEVLYEWIYAPRGGDWALSTELRTEAEAASDFTDYEYEKTGREFKVNKRGGGG